MSPSSASGERTPPALSTNERRGRRGSGARPTRSAIVNGGQSERVGGHRRRHRDREPAVRRAHRLGRLAGRGARARARRCASSPDANDCTGLCARTVRPRRDAGRATAAVTHVLPTSVPVPATRRSRIDVTAPGRSAEHVAPSARLRGDRPARRCARPTARPAGATCPGATVGGRIAGTSRPRSSSAAAAVERALLRRRTRTAGSATGVRAAGGRRARAGARRARRLPRERSTSSAASAAAVSAGVGAVVKMYGRARFSTSST